MPRPKSYTFCTSYDCLVRTCEFHRCHFSKRYRKPIIWIPWIDCEKYKGRKRWHTIYTPYVDPEDEEQEDD